LDGLIIDCTVLDVTEQTRITMQLSTLNCDKRESRFQPMISGLRRSAGNMNFHF
jgi:hypothetical protein